MSHVGPLLCEGVPASCSTMSGMDSAHDQFDEDATVNHDMTAAELRRARRAGAGAGLRRFLGPQQNVWGDRVYHLVLALGVVSTAVLVGSMSSVAAAVFGMGTAVMVGLGVRAGVYAKDKALAVVSPVVALVVMYVVLPRLLANPVAPMQVSWAMAPLTVAAAVAPMMPRRRFASPGVTALLGELVVIQAAGVGLVLQRPWTMVIVAAVGIVVVNVLRGGIFLWLAHKRAERRSRIFAHEGVVRDDARAVAQMSRKNLRRAAELEEVTGAQLEQLTGWRVMHSRAIPGTVADADHLALGPGGLVMVDAKAWSGEITIHQRAYDHALDREAGATALAAAEPARPGQPVTVYGINGYVDRLEKLVAGAYEEISAIAQPLNLDPTFARVVIAFGEAMKFDGPICGRSGALLKVDLVHASQVREYVESLPPLEWVTMTPTARQESLAAGGDPEADRVKAEQDYLTDLYHSIDYMCPPKR